MFRSIKWRFIVIYFMLVFIGMVISGIFIIQSIEQYNYVNIDNRIDSISSIVLPRISEYDNLNDNAVDIQQILNTYSGFGFREEIFVIDIDLNYTILATNSENRGREAIDILDFDLIVGSSNGKEMQDYVSKDNNYTSLKTRDMAYPVGEENNIRGILYIRYDLAEVYENTNKSKVIIIQSTFLASFITVILGFFIAKSITDPINDVTDKAAKMAAGDFNQVVEVKSGDEIGKLAEMFNYLTKRLKTSLSEISSEKSKLEAIINYMDDGLIAVNTKGEIIHLNPKAIAMLNFTETSLDFNKIVGDLNEDLMIENIIKKDDSWLGSSCIKVHDSIYKVSYAPYANENLEKSGIVFVLQDITEQEKLENMRRDFVANVSHELKTPLTSIKSYTETILDGMVDDPETQREFLMVVSSEADRMNRLVQDLLQLSSFDTEKVRLKKEVHDYMALVTMSIKKFEVTTKSKNQTIEILSDEDEILGRFDYYRIEQVIINIVSNAIKYSFDGSTLVVNIDSHGDYVNISVKDNGMGIPEKDLTRIFERFYRVDKARTRENGGTGLGLSIAKEIVEAHGGMIKINSTVDIGTTVTISLPKDSSETYVLM
ncbi:MAG: ATP-binding protein [Acidaminobacteraceae bacterium]